MTTVTFSGNNLALSNDRILDITLILKRRAIADDRSLNIASRLDCHTVHDDAVGELDLLLDAAVWTDATVFDRCFVTD